MEAEKKPVAKPRKKQTQASDELGPPPPLPTHRMFKPFTDQEISSVIAKAPDAINSEIGGTSSFQLSPEKINEIDKVDDESSTSISENKEDNGLKVEIDHDYEDIVEPEVSEKPITPTARVTEKPLTVLLPKEASPPPLPPRQVYPKLTSISSPADLFELETTRFQSVLPAVAEPPTFSEVVKYPKIRPDVAESSFIRSSSASLHYFQEAELLTEGQLLDYYQNEQLDLVDDFVDTFNEQQLNPHNALFDLLSMYKDVCEKLQLTSDAKQTTVADLTKINNEVWVIEEKVVNETGRCGDDRAASGSASYKEAKFIAAKIVELKEKLSELSRRELDETFCQEIRARSLALQIQWTVVMINNEFLAEVKAGATAMPTLLSTNHNSVKRNQLRGALSDLFYFLRFPVLPKRFSDSIYAWIIELTSVLYKSCTTDDQMFILCHILRTPSPVTPWSTQLVQTFISVPSLDPTKPINSFLALLSLAVQSPRMREQFLNRIQKYYEGDNSWNVISDDGDNDNANMLQMNEVDLVAIFGQFDIKSLFLMATRQFSFLSQSNRRQTMLSLIAFTLVVTKLLDEGLKTYAGLKNVCKKLASNIRSLCQNLCSYWEVVKPDIQSQADQRMIQNEINRIVLQSMYYIVSKKSAGLWQFLVDFPFSSVTEFCRQRCQLLLRSPKDYTVAKLYEIPDESLSQSVKTAGSLVDRLLDVGKDEHFMLSALAAIISKSENDLGFYVDEMIRVCFLDEATRENYYKVGSEAMAVLIERCPKLLSSILNFIDRNVDHLDQYAIDILTNASLKDCVLSKEDVEARLAKWLINRPVEHPANHIARRVLTSVNWGSTGQLWMPQEVHEACADAIVKAHIVKCKTRNSLIAKSYKKAASMATKCPDLEHQFDKFCWDVLIRLKFVSKPSITPPQNDLTAFFVYLMQKCLITADVFLDNGTKPFHELVNSSCFIPAVVFLSRLVTAFPSKIPVLVQNETFRECVDRLLHADESSYALQLLMGADKFPGPVLKMLLASISHNLTTPSHHSLKDLVVAWLQVVTCKKAVEWNTDKPVLCVIGMIVGIALEKDPENLFGLVDIITDIYRNQLTAWRESSKGIMSWFSTQIPPPLLPSHLMTVSPWASFVLLLAEPKVHSGFYSSLYIGIQKHPQRPLEEHVKKASSKSHVNLTIERLDYFRWLELVNSASTNHPAYPLICQQLCTVMFERKSAEKKLEKLCPGEKYFKCPSSIEMFNTLRNDVLPKAEKNATKDNLRSFYHAVPQWLFTEALYQPNFTRFSDLILDYLLQMIVVGDRHYWIDLVQMDKVHSKIQNEAELFSTSCHLENFVTIENRNFERKFTSSSEFFNFLQIPSAEIVAFPNVPMHEGLPTSDGLSFTDCCSPQYVLQKFASYFDDVGKVSKTFIDGKENVNLINVKYLELFGKLYHTVQTTLMISLKCGNIFSSKCQRPSNANVVVSASQYDTNIAAQMNENRQKREEEVAKLLTMLDVTAIKSAHAEFIARTLNLYGHASKTHLVHFDKIRLTGKSIFYHICQSVTTTNLLFPAATDAYVAMMKCLGSIFIANQAAEQFVIMQLVLSGSPLSHFLYEHFTPHCVPADQLLQLYSELSRCVRNQATAAASFELLKRLDIQHAGDQMPPNQFICLMPIIYENLVSANGTNPDLAKLCCDHFVHALFHHFPQNFVNGFAQLLCGADTQGLPAEIFNTISDQLEMDMVIGDNRLNITKCSLNSQISLQCIQVLSAQLVKSRRELTTRLFTVWAPYLGHICKFAEFFIKSYVSQTFNSALPPTVMENELRNVFNLILSIWNPLLEPINNGLAPWSPSDQFSANFAVEKFVRILIWLPHSTYLPPGSETIESLFWEHFSSRLMALQKAGTAHVYPVYEEKVIGLNWSRYWPTLIGIAAMDNLMTEGAAEIGPLVTEIFIRIPWSQIVQHQQNQPIEAHKAFHSLLLSLLCRCSYRSANYAKSRASVERLQAALLNSCHWYYAKADVIEKLGSFIVSHYPNDTLTIPNDVIKTFFNIWRQACFFSTTLSKPPPNAGDVEIVRKQATYLRTDLRLMLKTNWQIPDMQKHLREMLTKVDLIVGSGDKSAYIQLAKELTSFLIEIPKDKTTHSLVKTLGEWLRDHPESGIVLLLMHTTMQSLANANPQLGLKLLNKCLKAYFHRKISCDWLEVCQWLSVPQRTTEWLYTTPSLDAKIKPYFLVLNAHLIQEMSNLQSVQAEISLLKRLQEYLVSIKPKYIKPKKESAFLLCLEKLQRMVIRQYSNGISTSVANEHLENYLILLKKIHSDEKSGSIFSFFGKKAVFPIKLQLFSQIIYLFVTQQQMAPGQSPRLQSNQAVLNSRIQAFKDLQNNKQFAEFSNVFQFSSPFFTQVESYCLTNIPTLFAKIANLLYPNDKSLYKLDV